MAKAWNAIVWTDTMLNFLKDNFFSLTNKQLADSIGLKLTAVRSKCYELGLKRMELEYWDEDQISFLLNNYQKMGDMEIADLFNYLCPKLKAWTVKHIAKKRNYLGLKRSKSELQAIHKRNVDLGYFKMCPINAWKTRGVTKEGVIKYWKRESGKMLPVIKVNGAFVHWAPYTWEKAFGPVPKNMNVVFKDGDPYHRVVSNLEIITNAELGRRNADISSKGLSNNYVAGITTFGNKELRKLLKENPKLIELKRKQLQLKRTINGHEPKASTGSNAK